MTLELPHGMNLRLVDRLPTREARLEAVSEALLALLGEDPTREGLRRTPARMARALLDLTAGYDQRPEDVVNGAVFEEPGAKGMVLVRDVTFHSLCEHHLLPFHGTAHVAYLPQGRVLGLSKVPRVVDVFARRLQVQERLTGQVADALDRLLAPRGVAVVIEAAHMCMAMRGVEKQDATTRTEELRGVFATDPEARQAFRQALP